MIGRAVRGASHRRSGAPLQDAIRWDPPHGEASSLVVAVADGHGSPVCVRSKVGAELAVETATSLLQEFHERIPVT